MNETDRLSRLEPPSGPARVVLDTDTYNEIDDQFAIVYAMMSPEVMAVEAIYAAPFYTDLFPKPRSSSPADGMEKSYEEILRVLGHMGITRDGFVFRGSTDYLGDDETPAPESAAVSDLITRARAGEGPLYVLSIGAITNIASALLLAPDIADKLVVVWLGSHAFWWPNTREFNHTQDIPAVRVVFGSGVPIVHIPCLGVASHLITGPAEMNQEVRGRGAIGDYLSELVESYEYRMGAGWSKVLWDIATVAWLVNPRWVPSQLVHSPIAQDDATWSFSKNRHFIRQAYWINRDLVYHDLFKKLAAWSQAD